MSIIAVKNAFNVTGLKPGPLVTLLALAECHNKETGRCFPSIDHLSAKTNLSTRQVQRHINTLKKADVIRVKPTRNGGKWPVNYYSFNWPSPDDILGNEEISPDDISGSHQTTSTVSPDDTRVVLTGIEPEVESGTPADTPQVDNHKVYSAFEEEIEKFLGKKPILTKKEKGQLKTSANYFTECGVDAVAVIRKAIPQWDRFKVVARASRGWSKAFDGGGLSPNPTTQTLVSFRKEAVEYIREAEIQVAENAKWVAKKPAPIFPPLTVVTPAVINAPNLELLESLESISA